MTRFWLLALLIFLSLSPTRSIAQPGRGYPELAAKLRAEVRDFDNHGEPLISTLMRIAAENQLPMGIERIVKDALEKPVHVQLSRGTVSALLDSCVRQFPGYAWTVRNGAVNVYGEEHKWPANIFNEVIPLFEVQDQSAGMIQLQLARTLIVQALKPKGIAGSFRHPMTQDKKLLSFRERNATVRRILNRVVTLHGGAIWIARVPPKWLSNRPGDDSFEILPVSERNIRAHMLLLQGW